MNEQIIIIIIIITINEVLLMRKRNHEWDEGLINHREGRKETARPVPEKSSSPDTRNDNNNNK